jgi:predicted nucleic acid-binding protein
VIGSEKVFLDTAPFIYLIEDNPKYAKVVANYIADQIVVFESALFTSAITIAEFSVKPKRNNDLAVIEKFKSKLKEHDIRVFDITEHIAELSADLRAKYHSLKNLDALQLATAVSSGCTSFLTNDIKLKSIQEIKIVLLDDLI